MEEKLFHAEQALKKLKRHTEKVTCPEDLRHKADEFKHRHTMRAETMTFCSAKR